MIKKTKISLIITTYKNEETIEKCLKSIKKQNFKDFELIVVDENSTDNTAKIARKYADIVIIGGKERCQKRNIGANKSKADYLFFIDSDMELSPGLLDEINGLLEHKTLIMIPEVSFGKGYWAKCKAFERSFYVGGDLSQGVRIYPKRIFLDVKGFDEKVLGAEDLDLFNRIKKTYKSIKILESKNYLLHNEGHLNYFQIIKRMKFYSKSFKEYKSRHPEVFKKQTSPLRYIRNLSQLITHPVLAFGFILIKTGEALTVLYNLNKN